MMMQRVILLFVVSLVLNVQVFAATVSGVISDTEGNPIDNIRVKFRGGITSSRSDSREFGTDWYYEDMIRVEEDGSYSFTVPDPGYSIDSNHIFMLYTISGVDSATKIWNTTESPRFLIRNGVVDTVVNLQTSKIIFSPMTVKVKLADETPVDGIMVGATLLVNAGGSEAGLTDATGIVTFDGAIPGDYRVTANGLGYTVVSESYTLTENNSDTLVITVAKSDSIPNTGEIHGTIKDADGNPIEGGLSVIKFGGKENREIFVGISDADGNFVIYNIPEIYLGVEGKIEIGADGYKDAEEAWTVSGEDLIVNYVLDEVGGNGTAVNNIILNSRNPISIRTSRLNSNFQISVAGIINKGNVNIYSVSGRKILSKAISSEKNSVELPSSLSGQMLIVNINTIFASYSFKCFINR